MGQATGQKKILKGSLKSGRLHVLSRETRESPCYHVSLADRETPCMQEVKARETGKRPEFEGISQLIHRSPQQMVEASLAQDVSTKLIHQPHHRSRDETNEARLKNKSKHSKTKTKTEQRHQWPYAAWHTDSAGKEPPSQQTQQQQSPRVRGKNGNTEFLYYIKGSIFNQIFETCKEARSVTLKQK